MAFYLGLVAAAALAVPTVNTTVSGCPQARAAELERLLEVELTGRPPQETTSLTIVCTPSAVLMTSSAGVRERLRELNPGTDERTIALAAIELLDALEQPPAPPVTPAPRHPQPEPQRWLLSASGAVGLTNAPRSIAYGGGLALDARVLDALPQLALHIDVTALRTPRDLSAGDVSLTLLGVGVAADWWTTHPRWRAAAGVGLRGGPAFVDANATADATTARSATRGWLGPFLHARLEHDVSERLVLLTGVEAGYVTRSVALRVDRASEASLNGAWLLAVIGIGWSL